MNARPRLVFVINSIGTGGAERALDRILRGGGDRLAQLDIHLVLLDDEAERRAMPPLPRHVLAARGGLIRSSWRLNALLRRLKPDLVVSFLVRANLATAIAGPLHAKATILCERMHLSSHLAGRYQGWRHRLLRALPRLLYERADAVLAVSQGVSDDLVSCFGLPPRLVQVIPNGYDIGDIATAADRLPAQPLPPRFAVAVGRLVAAKNMGMLAEAWRRFRPPLPLLILGEGPDYAALQDQITAAHADVTLLGYVEDPFPIVGRAEFLVSASRNEGFPNAIAEAMSLGVPVISSDCPSGPAELLGQGAGAPGVAIEAPYGLITPVDDLTALGDALGMMLEPARRERLATAARERMTNYHIDQIAALYWAEFDRFLGSDRAVESSILTSSLSKSRYNDA